MQSGQLVSGRATEAEIVLDEADETDPSGLVVVFEFAHQALVEIDLYLFDDAFLDHREERLGWSWSRHRMIWTFAGLNSGFGRTPQLQEANLTTENIFCKSPRTTIAYPDRCCDHSNKDSTNEQIRVRGTGELRAMVIDANSLMAETGMTRTISNRCEHFSQNPANW